MGKRSVMAVFCCCFERSEHSFRLLARYMWVGGRSGVIAVWSVWAGWVGEDLIG